jgi:hypothetical protein
MTAPGGTLGSVSAELSSVHARPRRVRVVCWILALAVLAMSLAGATAVHGVTDGGKGTFQRGDQAALIALGVLLALGILAFTRPRVTADARHVVIRNVVGGYDLPWAVVRAVRFDRGSPWVTLDLQDDDVVAVMAIQAADKEYALARVRELRALFTAYQEAAAA